MISATKGRRSRRGELVVSHKEQEKQERGVWLVVGHKGQERGCKDDRRRIKGKVRCDKTNRV